MRLVDELARKLSSGHQTGPILLDFSKAFDKVSHTKLFYKLHQHGLTSYTLNWIKAFSVGSYTVCGTRRGNISYFGHIRGSLRTELVCC